MKRKATQASQEQLIANRDYQKNPAMEYVHTEAVHRYLQVAHVFKPVQQVASSIQKIQWVDSPVLGRMLLLDDVLQIGSLESEIYHESFFNLAPNFWKKLNQKERSKVLIIGGGDGLMAKHVCHRLDRAKVIVGELDQAVVQSSKEHLWDINQINGQWVFEHPRVKVMINDGLVVLKDIKEQSVDAIILDLPDYCKGTMHLYDERMISQLERVLKPSSLVAVHTGPVALGGLMRTVELMLIKQLKKQMGGKIYQYTSPYIYTYGSCWGFAAFERQKSDD